MLKKELVRDEEKKINFQGPTRTNVLTDTGPLIPLLSRSYPSSVECCKINIRLGLSLRVSVITRIFNRRTLPPLSTPHPYNNFFVSGEEFDPTDPL